MHHQEDSTYEGPNLEVEFQNNLQSTDGYVNFEALMLSFHQWRIWI